MNTHTRVYMYLYLIGYSSFIAEAVHVWLPLKKVAMGREVFEHFGLLLPIITVLSATHFTS